MKTFAAACRYFVLLITALALTAGTLSPVAAATLTAAEPTTENQATAEPAVEPTATISGLVNNTSGDLLDGIVVEAFRSDAPGTDPVASDITYEGPTSEHGSFTLHVPAGSYTIRYSSLDYVREAYETYYYGGGAGSAVAVADGDALELDPVILTADVGAPVTGTVVDKDNDPLPGIDVALFRYSLRDGTFYEIDWTTTDSEGNYTFDRVNRGRVHTVQAWGRYDRDSYLGYTSLHLGNKLLRNEAETFTLPVESTGTTLSSIQLTPGVTLSGRVTDEAGAPVPDAEVALQAYDATTGEFEYVDWGYTDRTGEYTISGVAPDHTYTLFVYGEWIGFLDAYLGGGRDAASAETFVPAEGTSTLTIDPIALTRSTATATGVVVDAAGTPLQGVSVSLYKRYESEGWSSFDVIEETTTDVDGSFVFARVRPGHTYTVFAQGYAAGFGSTYLGDVSTEQDATTFALPDDGSAIALDTIMLVREATTVRGRVMLSDGAAIDGQVEVELLQWDEAGQYFRLVDEFRGSTARYTFRDVAPGAGYTVRARYYPDSGPSDLYADGWLADAGQPTGPASNGIFEVPEAAEDVVAGDITLERARRLLTGSLTAADGSVLYGWARVELHRWDPASSDFQEVDATYVSDDEDYRFVDVPEGTYAVRATYYPYRAGDENVYLSTWNGGIRPTGPESPGVFTLTTSGDLSGVDIALLRGQRVSGTVSSVGGVILADTWIDLYEWVDHGDSWSLEAVGSARSGADGRYTVAAAPNSAVWMMAYRDGFAPFYLGGVSPQSPDETNNLHVGETDLTDIDVTMTPEWGVVGERAGEQRDFCLQNTFWNWENVPFGPASGLRITGTGLISDQGLGDYRPELLEPTGRASVLAPFMARRDTNWSQGDQTWGISPDGNTLCVLWSGVRYHRGTGTNTYQALVTKDPAGGYDVTYNYDQVTWSRKARVGYTEGTGDEGTHLVLAGAENGGYLDSAVDTGLVHNSLGSDTPGRYVFHFDGFDAPHSRPYNVARPRVEGTTSAGETLTATPGRWRVDGVVRDDLELVYTWKSNAAGYPRIVGTGETYTVTDADTGGRLWVSVQASQGAPLAGFASSERLLVGTPAATSVQAPEITPTSARVGEVLSASTGAWQVDGGTLADLTFSYQWLRNGSRIRGATESTYVVRDADELADLRVVVSAARDGYIPARATSEAVTIDAIPQLTAAVAPSLSGEPAVGQALTVDPGQWDTDGTGEPTFTYEWVVDYRTVLPDPGTDGTQYTLRPADAGHYVTVYVRAEKAGFRSGSAHVTSPVVAGPEAEFGSLSGTVTRTADQEPVPNATWVACEQETWNCVWGQTTSDGSFHEDAVWTLATGIEYTITVYAPWDANLHDGSGRTVVRPGETASVAIALDAVTPPPANVEVPTSTWTHQGSPVVYPSEPQEIVVSGCIVPDPSYTVTFSDGSPTQTGSLTLLDDRGDGTASYGATIPAFYPARGLTTISTNIPADCEPGTEPTTFTVYIDPSGVVTDQYGRPIAGATVTLLRADTAGGDFTVVPDGSDIMSEDNRVNPDTTDETGFFRWDVSEGYYKVQVDADGCNQLTTATMPVPPPAIDLLLKLDCVVDAPAPTTAPAITGTATVGNQLATDATVWPAPLSAQVQWLRDGQPIDGATGTSYTVTAADIGSELSVRHTAQRPRYVQEEGRGAPVTFQAVQATSDPVPATTDQAPHATTAPAITGTAKVDSTLTASEGTWDTEGLTFTFQWLRNGEPITGATGRTRQLTSADAGTAITVTVTAAKAGFPNGTATSGPVNVESSTTTTPPTTPPPTSPPPSGPAPEPTPEPTPPTESTPLTSTTSPAITGTAKVGNTLTVSEGTWNAEDLTFRYQWLRNGVAITGATGRTRQLVAADAGAAITVEVTASKDGYEDGSATSTAVRVAKLRSRTLVRLPKQVVKTVRAAKVVAAVRVGGVSSPLGKVTVFRGKKAVKTVRLVKDDLGRVVISLGKLRAGSYALSIRYSGTARIAPSRSTKVTLTVVR